MRHPNFILPVLLDKIYPPSELLASDGPHILCLSLMACSSRLFLRCARQHLGTMDVFYGCTLQAILRMVYSVSPFSFFNFLLSFFNLNCHLFECTPGEAAHELPSLTSARNKHEVGPHFVSSTGRALFRRAWRLWNVDVKRRPMVVSKSYDSQRDLNSRFRLSASWRAPQTYTQTFLLKLGKRTSMLRGPSSPTQYFAWKMNRFLVSAFICSLLPFKECFKILSFCAVGVFTSW